MESKIKHLEMIQSCISRMAGNSFTLKAWAVTLVAGIFALSSKDADRTYFLVAYVPIFIFWWLDAYYLFQERMFRALYDQVRKMDESKINFSMDTSSVEFHANNSYKKCLFSKTIISFYLPLCLLSALVTIVVLI